MMQGDSYSLAFTVKNNAGAIVTPADIMDMAITICYLTKTYRKVQVTYRDGKWLFPLTQKETFSLRAMSTKGEMAIKWLDGIIERKPIYGIRVYESIGREVL